MKIIMVKPEQEAYVAEIDGSLASIQETVGGLADVVHRWREPVVLVCNGEYKLNGMPFNRVLFSEAGDIDDVVAGDFFLCGQIDGDLVSMPDTLVDKYLKLFYYPQYFEVSDSERGGDAQ